MCAATTWSQAGGASSPLAIALALGEALDVVGMMSDVLIGRLGEAP